MGLLDRIRNALSGGSGSDGSTMRISLDAGEAKGQLADASRQMGKLDREVSDVERKARRAKNLADQARRTGSGGGTLLERLRARGIGISAEGIGFKGLKIGAGGFTIEGGEMIGALGHGMVAMAAVRTGASALEKVVRIRDMMRGGMNTEDAIRQAGTETLRGTFDQVTNMIGAQQMAAGFTALATGWDFETSQRATRQFIEDLFKSESMRIREETERFKAIAEANREIDAQYDSILNKLTHTAPRTFKLKGSKEATAYQRAILEAATKKQGRYAEAIDDILRRSAKSRAEFKARHGGGN